MQPRALLLLASLGSAAALRAKTSPNERAVRPVLALRGGLGGVEGQAVAVVSACVTGAHSVYCGLAPEAACRAYGMPRPNFAVAQLVRACGCTGWSSIVLILSLMYGVSTNQAIAWALLPLAILTLDNILNKNGQQMGQPAYAQPLLLGITLVTMYCAFLNVGMPFAAFINAGWAMLNGAAAVIAPVTTARAWGLGGDMRFIAMFKNLGWNLSAYAVLLYLVANGEDVVTAVGYYWAVNGMGLIEQKLLSGSFDYLGVDDGPLFVWVFLTSVFVVFTLLF